MQILPDTKEFKVLLITPPMVDVNNPYPATAYLTGFLRSAGIAVSQADLSIELACRLFSRASLKRLGDCARRRLQTDDRVHPAVDFFLEAFPAYERTVEPVIRFLQGDDPALAHRLIARGFCPEGPGFAELDTSPDLLLRGFGALGLQDQAKYLATLYLGDIVSVIEEVVDPEFSLLSYGQNLASSIATFGPFEQRLAAPRTLIDDLLRELLTTSLLREQPSLVGITVPFPGNLYGALRCAEISRQVIPGCTVALGGGYVNTELRDLQDPGIFKYVDFITLDDGERPLLCVIEHLKGQRDVSRLYRTFFCRDGVVKYVFNTEEHDVAQKHAGYPTYDGLPLKSYFSLLATLNPMLRFWSDLRWNKLTLAHGCYWKKCSFCDVSLDYIGRYDASPVDLIIERMERLISETGQSAFHFVDEAAPPSLLKALSKRLLEKEICCSWWGNIRFEKAFTRDVVDLMAAAGCVAISGGLEVASDRLLDLMRKGVTVKQVARVARTFKIAGILVHAYLMYGFPTQTLQETIDSLELVRQLFKEGCIQSAFWHRFTATTHSPIGQAPEHYGIKLRRPSSPFATNVVPFEDPIECDHARLGIGLHRAASCFQRGIGLEEDVRVWFDIPVPSPQVSKDLIANAVADVRRRQHNHPHGPAKQQWKPVGRQIAEDLDSAGSQRMRVSGSVVSRQVGERTELLDLNEGKLYVLDEVASRMWRLSREFTSREQVVAALEQEYDAERRQIEQDLATLVDGLKRNGILQDSYLS